MKREENHNHYSELPTVHVFVRKIVGDMVVEERNVIVKGFTLQECLTAVDTIKNKGVD